MIADPAFKSGRRLLLSAPMKTVFGLCFAGLVLASALTAWWTPPKHADRPVLYWVTDANPARPAQVESFYRWLARHGHPPVEVRLDPANNDPTKKIIQGVSGVGGDLLDMYGGAMVRYVQAVGVLADVTDAAEQGRFTPAQTYPGLRDQLVVDGRQYGFPANVYLNLLFVNQATFRRHGQPLPPRRWTLEEFERAGKAFVAAANPPGQRRRVFFVNTIYPPELRRSLGLDTFNETMTRCTLDDPRWVTVMKLIHQWTYDDHLLPSAAEFDSFATEMGFAGAEAGLFRSGNFAMIEAGRQTLVQFREYGALELGIAEPPHGGFPNTYIDARVATVYVASRHRAAAERFLAFLASEDYNAQIVADADSLPPNPAFTHSAAYRQPPQYPNEWECHAAFAESAETIGIGDSHSPFVLPSEVANATWPAYQGFMAGIYSADQAAIMAADRINAAIQRTLAEKPGLRPAYEELIARQKQIEEWRAAGRPVPLAWITNPFHRQYYRELGWAE